MTRRPGAGGPRGVRGMLGAAALLGLLALLATPPGAAGQEREMDHAGMDGQHAMAVPDEGLVADLAADLGRSSEKLLGLAEALRGHWDWRPEPGVRSVGEVMAHVAATNFLLPVYFGHHAPERYREDTPEATWQQLMALEDDAADVEVTLERLRHSFMHARHGLAGADAATFEDPVDFFGEERTVRSVMMEMIVHVHEHLGQSIAYARSNGVTPPWSR